MKNIKFQLTTENFSFPRNPIFYVFIISILYWIYLSLTTTMVINFDAANYQREGRYLFEEGLVSFFKYTVHEIFYPFLIATAMRIADFFSLSSHFMIQKWIQICFLFMTQFLLCKILTLLNIKQGLKVLILLYCGFSPALVNMTFSSFREVTSFPLTLGIVLISYYSWKTIQQGKIYRALLFGVLSALLFACISLILEAYQFIFIFFAVCYFCVLLIFIFQKHRPRFLRCAAFLIAFFLSYNLILLPYHSLARKYRTDLVLSKGIAPFYGGAFARSQELSTEQLLSFFAYVAGENVVKKFFGEKAFQFWWDEQYQYGVDLEMELEAQKLSPKEIRQVFYKRIIESIMHNPFQYVLLTAAEGMKMLFWESTRIGFVVYPPWLDKIFNLIFLKNALRLLIFLMTFFALVWSIVDLYRNATNIYFDRHQTTNNTRYVILLFCLSVIIFNIVVYAPFIIVTRYALPLAPVYLILIAFCLQKFIFEKTDLSEMKSIKE